MKKFLLLVSFSLLLSGCSIISELAALKKCEFRFHSVQEPVLCGIDVSQKRSWSDFSFLEGQAIALQLLKKTLPFDITINVEVRNPGKNMAAVNSIQWIVFLDELQVAQGAVEKRVEVPPSGGTNMIPIRIHTDLIDYLEGDNPRAMLNFALDMVNASDQGSQVTMKIKPSIMIGSQNVQYPDYFVITKEFTPGD
jgi:hypothetical protein